MLINLWVRDKMTGCVHQVGTNEHDSVELLNGEAHYYNLQNGCGTLDAYEWIEAPDPDGYVSVTPEQLLLNRELMHRDVLEMLTKGQLASKEKQGEDVTDKNVGNKGEWMEFRLSADDLANRWKCSMCRKEHHKKTAFCPGCGAKMRGE